MHVALGDRAEVGYSATRNTSVLRGVRFSTAMALRGLDASLFKFTNITEKVALRLNIDFFNVLNNPNNPTAVSGDAF